LRSSPIVRLFVYKDVVFVLCPKEMRALDAATGKTLWTAGGGGSFGATMGPELFRFEDSLLYFNADFRVEGWTRYRRTYL
jgi:hypothetical protein